MEVDVAGGLALFLRQAVEVGDALADGLGLLVGVFFLDVEHKGTGIKGAAPCTCFSYCMRGVSLAPTRVLYG